MANRRNERRPDIIRTMVVANDPKLIESIQLHLAESFPIRLISTAREGRECLRRARALMPHVLLIADDIEDIPPLELSKQVNLTLPSTATIMLTRQDSVEYRDRSSAVGAWGVVPIPLARERLVTSITRAYEFLKARVKGQPLVEAGARGRIVILYSAKGGVGKSLLASNLAAVIAQAQPAKKVVLADLNLQFGTLNALLDIRPPRSIHDLLEVVNDLSATAIDNVLYKRRFKDRYEVSVLSSPLEPRQADEFTGQHISTILMALKTYYDFIIVDTPSPVSDITLSALEVADHILLICTPDMLSIRQTRAALEFLGAPEFRISRDAIGLVINHVDRGGEIKPEDIKRLFDCPVISEIPSDARTIQYHLSSGKMLVEASETSPVIKAIRRIAGRLGLISTKAEKRRVRRKRRR